MHRLGNMKPRDRSDGAGGAGAPGALVGSAREAGICCSFPATKKRGSFLVIDMKRAASLEKGVS